MPNPKEKPALSDEEDREAILTKWMEGRRREREGRKKMEEGKALSSNLEKKYPWLGNVKGLLRSRKGSPPPPEPRGSLPKEGPSGSKRKRKNSPQAGPSSAPPRINNPPRVVGSLFRKAQIEAREAEIHRQGFLPLPEAGRRIFNDDPLATYSVEELMTQIQKLRGSQTTTEGPSMSEEEASRTSN